MSSNPETAEVECTVLRAIKEEPALLEQMLTGNGEPNETSKQVLRYMFQHASVLTVSHLSSIVPLSVRMTPKAYTMIVKIMLDGRMVPDEDYKPVEMSPHVFFAVHDLLWLGLVEETENLDG